MPSSFNLLAPKQIKTWGPGQFGGSVQLGNAVVISDGFAILFQKELSGKNQMIEPHSLRQKKRKLFLPASCFLSWNSIKPMKAIISSINDQRPMKA